MNIETIVLFDFLIMEDVFVEFDKTSYNIQQHFFGLSASLSF